jgi:GTP-binding protein
MADRHRRSLLDVSYTPHFHAEQGVNGQGSNRVGHGGEDLIIQVPVGTMVFREGKLLVDLKNAEDTFLVARGGRGGRGNASFKTQRNTAPMLSEKGEPGEEFHLDLELKLLADVGLIGMPNAGKSTLLSRLTSARPKIADYPFTTLNPNLGVADWHGVRIVFADIPGLIEGAHEGRGLGHDFLRHVERTRLLMHLVDINGFQEKDPIKNVRLVNQELKLYSQILAKKPMVIVANKVDVGGGEKAVASLKRHFKTKKVFGISAVSGEGINSLLAYAAKELARPMSEETEPAAAEPLRFVVEMDYYVERTDDGFVVKGAKVEKLAAMTNFGQREALRRFQNILKKMGVEKALARQGASPGDNVRIGKVEFSYES